MKRFIIALATLLVCGTSLAAVNLNTATKDELVALPGIGPAKAQAIVDYRNQHGPFRSIDEIRKVKGIGEKLFISIKPELSIGAPARGAAVAAPAKGDPKADAKAGARAEGGVIAKDDKARR
jgi:competence protein ComEA